MSTITTIVVPTWALVSLMGLLILSAIVSAWSGYWYRRHALAEEDRMDFDADVALAYRVASAHSPAVQSSASGEAANDAHAKGA